MWAAIVVQPYIPARLRVWALRCSAVNSATTTAFVGSQGRVIPLLPTSLPRLFGWHSTGTYINLKLKKTSKLTLFLQEAVLEKGDAEGVLSGVCLVSSEVVMAVVVWWGSG